MGQVSERKEGYTYSWPEWESKPGCRASESFFRHHQLCGTRQCGSLLDAAVLCASLSPGHPGLCALTARPPNSPPHPEFVTQQYRSVCRGWVLDKMWLWVLWREGSGTPAVPCSSVRRTSAWSVPSGFVLQQVSSGACEATLVQQHGSYGALTEPNELDIYCLSKVFSLPRTRLCMTLVWTPPSSHTLM